MDNLQIMECSNLLDVGRCILSKRTDCAKNAGP